MPVLPGLRSRTEGTVYECDGCGERFIGAQRCESCNLFARRIGAGGPCPHCDEPVAITELVEVSP
jgi:rubrerythrin